jgi:hypothetical protein
MWNPVIDEDIMPEHTYRAFYEGKFVPVPTIFGDDTNGGSGFPPRSTNTVREFNSFLTAQFPALSRAHLDDIETLYNGTRVSIPNAGAHWCQTGTAYGEMRYMCPNMFLASAAARYKGRHGLELPVQRRGPDALRARLGRAAHRRDERPLGPAHHTRARVEIQPRHQQAHHPRHPGLLAGFRQDLQPQHAPPSGVAGVGGVESQCAAQAGLADESNEDGGRGRGSAATMCLSE